MCGFFLERLHDQGFERGRDSSILSARWNGCQMQNSTDQFDALCLVERASARGNLIEHRTYGIDVTAGISGERAQLLWSHVRQRANGCSRACQIVWSKISNVLKRLGSGLIISSHSCFLKPQEHVQSGFDDQVYGGSGMIWARMLAYITGTVDQELLLRNEYLAAENRILEIQLRGRVKLSDAERATLAEIGHRLGRKVLDEVATIARPDTILAWYRKLVAHKFDGSQARRTPGRPPIDRDVE